MFFGRVKDALSAYAHPRVLAMAVLGFPYGMMYFLAIPTLQTWLKQVGVPNEDIGLFAFATIPYVLKFLWAPLIGLIRIPYLGKRLGNRRSWLITAHLFLILFLVLLGFSDPSHHLWYVATLSVTLLFFAAIQDIVVDAYRIEILRDKQMGPGVGMLITGYRLGSMAAQAGTLYLAAHFNWTLAYCVMASLVTMGIVAALLNPEPKAPPTPPTFAWRTYLVPPLKEFFSRPGCWTIIFFIVLYRVGDAFINNMANIFYMEIGFSITEIADVTKIFGVLPTLLGGLFGGVLALRIPIYRALFLVGAIHMASHVMYLGQSVAGHNTHWLYALIFLENITSGMTTAVFLVYLSQQVSRLYVATQYAFFTSLWSLSTFISGGNGFLLKFLGGNWTLFFGTAILVSIPGLLLIPRLKRTSPT